LSLTPYQVLLRDLPVKREISISTSFVAEATRGLAMREALGAPADDPNAGSGSLVLDLYSEGAHVFASGRITGHVIVACSRCIEPVKLAFDEQLRVTFLPQAELPTPDEKAAAAASKSADEDDGVAITEDDLDLFGYDGEVIDLEPLVREQFVLAVPYSPLCSEDCRGLCPQCGTNRNLSSCTCEGPGDPRLAGLKALKFPS
jgi:uncharacterized protein